MADRVLRDQCEHGRYEEHQVLVIDDAGGHYYEYEPCPGGREVTIDATFTSKYDLDTNSYGHPMEMGNWFWGQGKGEEDVTFALLRIVEV